MANYKIKVFGVGGGGSNTVDYIQAKEVEGIETYAINTDAQALERSQAQHHIHIGKQLTKGLGAGALPEVGRRAAEETTDELEAAINGADIAFIAAGMGGGTGTGAAPYIAQLAKKKGVLTIGVVTKPFNFEGPSRLKMAIEGIQEIEKNSDITIVIPNQKLVTNHKDKFLEDAFELPDDVLKTSISAIIEVLSSNNALVEDMDLNFLRSRLENQGLAVIGIDESANQEIQGHENTAEAILRAIRSDMLEISVEGARQFIVLVSGPTQSFNLNDMNVVAETLQSQLGNNITVSQSFMDDQTLPEYGRRAVVIATGYPNNEEEQEEVQTETSFRM